MLNLIKMDLYRLFRSKALRVGLIAAAITAFTCLLLALGVVEIFVLASEGQANAEESLVAMSPVFPMLGWIGGEDWAAVVLFAVGSFSLFIGCMVTASFIGAEQSCGYVKNIAGQIPHKGYLSISKFVASSVSQLLVLAVYIAVACPFAHILIGKYIVSYSVGALLAALGLRALLHLAVNAVIVFVCTLTKSHAIAMVIGAVLGSGVTSLVYFAINGVLSMLKITIDIAQFMPDGINGMLSIASLGEVWIKAIIVSVVFIAGFITGSFLLTEKRDVR